MKPGAPGAVSMHAILAAQITNDVFELKFQSMHKITAISQLDAKRVHQVLAWLSTCQFLTVCDMSQIAAVERFIVVHGQILLNQFKHFPNKAIQSCAFVNSLKTAMEARKHSKLYSSTKKAVKLKTANRNPMKVLVYPSHALYLLFSPCKT